ncbi:MAG: hypothetical protein FWD60_00420 [Candidatus Azobacteroides sp.]|nr:hypothetical protein [Candidatus Azobacteroides sp.]
MRTNRKLIIVFVAVFIGVTVTLQAQTTTDRIKAMKDSIELLKAQHELDSVKLVLDNAKKQQGIVEGTKVTIPCFDKVIDSSSDYITGFGIGEPGQGDDLFSQEVVYSNALAKAKNSIAAKWVGFVKNISKDYYSRTNEPDETTKAKFERSVQVAGETAINKFMQETCHSIEKTKRGTYVCYMAVKVSIEEVEKAIEDELNRNEIKHDSKALRQSVRKTTTN